MFIIRRLICGSKQVKRIKGDIQANQMDKKSAKESVIPKNPAESIYFRTPPPAHEKPHKGDAKELVFVDDLKIKNKDGIPGRKVILVHPMPEEYDDYNGKMINNLTKIEYRPSSRAVTCQ